MERQNTDHVVMDARTGTFWCRHCGARESVPMPLPISDFVSRSRSFTRRHASCPVPAEATQ